MAGCPVTSIQKIRGHKKLNTTMHNAYTYGAAVEADCFTSMKREEEGLQLGTEQTREIITGGESTRLLEIIQLLNLPELSYEQRPEITSQIQALLSGTVEVKQDEWIPPTVFTSQEG